MEVVLSVLMGLGLAAAAGFRVFVPLLVASVSSAAGWLQLDPQLAWIGSTPALICLGVATCAEIAAYKVPWVDNALDSIASPAAVVAGTVVAASQFGVITQNADMLKWGAALIAGGGIAGLVQLATVSTRLLSLGTTGGAANPLVGVFESTSAVVLSVVAVVLPILAGLFVLTALAAAVIVILHLRRRRQLRVALAGPMG
jgi:hypothetical protein